MRQLYVIFFFLMSAVTFPSYAGYWKLQGASYGELTKKHLETKKFSGIYTIIDHDMYHFTIKGETDVGVTVQRAYWKAPASLAPGKPIGAMVGLDCVSWKPYPGREQFQRTMAFYVEMSGVGTPVQIGGLNPGCGNTGSFSMPYNAIIPASRGGTDLVLTANAMSSGTLLVSFSYKWIADGSGPQTGSSGEPPTAGRPVGAPVNESAWSVNAHPVPWVFHANGTVEATGLWAGTWKSVADGIEVTLSHQGVTDRFLVKFAGDGKSFTAYKGGAVYRSGVRTR